MLRWLSRGQAGSQQQEAVGRVAVEAERRQEGAEGCLLAVRSRWQRISSWWQQKAACLGGSECAANEDHTTWDKDGQGEMGWPAGAGQGEGAQQQQRRSVVASQLKQHRPDRVQMGKAGGTRCVVEVWALGQRSAGFSQQAKHGLAAVAAKWVTGTGRMG
ncbi:hypothetical protein PWT90_11258 [Aphanocladium album]|nr:hypothetical protein PWT90_11258 [Aphanocladium album]